MIWGHYSAVLSLFLAPGVAWTPLVPPVPPGAPLVPPGAPMTPWYVILGPGWQKLAGFWGAQNNPSELS